MHTFYSFIYEHSAGWLRWTADGGRQRVCLLNSKVFIVRPITRDIKSRFIFGLDQQRTTVREQEWGGLCNIFTKMFVDRREVVHWAQHNISCQALSGKDTYGLTENQFLGSP